MILPQVQYSQLHPWEDFSRFPVFQVPFLSIGADNVGARTERCRGRSQLSGNYVVEDVEIEKKFYRSVSPVLGQFPPVSPGVLSDRIP